ncbi:MAG: hypothetical protein Q7K16_03085 [Candidatus Azambacteria bacterium]|nr:hypothetical protein [Candidatus Azambacteria bacterium]
MFKNLKIKKFKLFISAILSLVFIANASYAFATTFNNDPDDHATLRAINYTVYGDTNQNWSTSASGNAGDTISFAIYYHNTSSETATDVRAHLSPQSTGNGTSHQFNGTVSASNAISVSGSSNVFISSSQSMTYIPGTITWRPNQTVSGSESLLYGQNGTEIFTSSGLRLGNIAPGWSTQGSVVLRFKISNNTPPPPPAPSVSITANPTTINQGNSSVLTWSSNNATSCFASGGWSGAQSLSGSQSVFSSQTTSYSITCSNSAGQQISDSVTVNVSQQQQFFPSVTLTANPSVINVGNNSVLNWYSQNASYCIASGGWSGSKLVSGSETVIPFVSTNYNINCYNSFGQNSAATTIYVNGQQTFPTVNLSVNSSFIQNGQSAILVWSSNNASSCYASGGWYGNRSLSGSENVLPSLNTAYTITCSNNAGSVSDTETVTVTTPVVSPPTGLFNAACVASPEIARVGQTVAFAAGYAGGTAPYTYSWNQDISGSGLTRAVTFRTTGIKTVKVTITDGIGRTAQGVCSVRVNPAIVVVAPSAPKPKPPVITIAKTEACKCEGQGQGVQLIDASNETKGKDRSLAASLILNEDGKPSGAGLLLIWYFVILITVAFGACIYYLISNRKE